MQKSTTRYHIQLNNHRTTVSLDKMISDLIAIKLGKIPGTKQAHSSVRQQLEQFISEDEYNRGKDMAHYVLYKIRKDDILSEQYLDHWDQQNK
jgi:hypothetical protein